MMYKIFVFVVFCLWFFLIYIYRFLVQSIRQCNDIFGFETSTFIRSAQKLCSTKDFILIFVTITTVESTFADAAPCLYLFKLLKKITFKWLVTVWHYLIHRDLAVNM